jgi:hypothetical protein
VCSHYKIHPEYHALAAIYVRLHVSLIYPAIKYKRCTFPVSRGATQKFANCSSATLAATETLYLGAHSCANVGIRTNTQLHEKVHVRNRTFCSHGAREWMANQGCDLNLRARTFFKTVCHVARRRELQRRLSPAACTMHTGKNK